MIKWRALVCDYRDGGDGIEAYLSLGRLCFWIVFGFMCYHWIKSIPVPDTLFNTFCLLLFYNLSKKTFSSIADRLGSSVVKKS